jgi:hypothetical protein
MGQTDFELQAFCANARWRSISSATKLRPRAALKQHDVFKTAVSIALMRRNSKAEWATEINRLTVSRVTKDNAFTIIWVNCDYDLMAKALASGSLTPDPDRSACRPLPVPGGLRTLAAASRGVEDGYIPGGEL